MYQTRRQISLLKDKVNILDQNSDSNILLSKNLCKINLRKKGKISSRESVLKTSETICGQRFNKENTTTIDSTKFVQKKKQTSKIKQGIVPKKNAIINKAKNCIKQKEKKETEKCQFLICKEKFTDNLKSLNKEIKSSPIYSNCLKKNSNAYDKKCERIDVYDISADDDFKNEEGNQRKIKKQKLQDKKGKTKNFSANKKNIKKLAKVSASVQDKKKSAMRKNETDYQFIKPLSSKVSNVLEINKGYKMKDIPNCVEPCKLEEFHSATTENDDSNKNFWKEISSKVSNELSMQEGCNSKDIPKSKYVEQCNLAEEFCFELNTASKHVDSCKLFLREITPVRDVDFNFPNEDNLNSAECVLKLLPHTSTPQSVGNPCPTFTATPEFSFAARFNDNAVVPIYFEVEENIEEDCPDDPEENFESDEENKLNHVAEVDNYSLVLFGSPEKVAVENINSEKQVVSQFDATVDRKKGLNEAKKVVKQLSTKSKKPDIIQKKSNAERIEEEEEEKFYKSFNAHLSELEDYELCIE